MRAPILPYYGDQFMGIKPPTLVSKPIAVNGNLPCADSYDGSYFVVSYASVARYNKSKTLIWTLSNTDLVAILAGCSSILGFYFSRSDTTYYAVAYNDSTRGGRLFKLAAPTTNNTVTAVGSGFSTTDQYSIFPLQGTMWRQADGNFRLRQTPSGYITDTVISAAGAKISEARVSQNGIPLQYKPDGVLYETVDGTINFGFTFTNNVYGVIIKSGLVSLIPVNSAFGLDSAVVCKLWDDYVFLGGATGYKGVTIASLDQWLHDVCDAMGV